MNVAEEGFDCIGAREEVRDRLSVSFEFAVEDVMLMLVMWACEKVVSDCFEYYTLTVRA